MTIYLQINGNKLNKCNYRKSCNIYLLTAQYYFAIKKILIKSGLYKYNLHWQNGTNGTSIKSLGEMNADLKNLMMAKEGGPCRRVLWLPSKQITDNNLITSVSHLQSTGKQKDNDLISRHLSLSTNQWKQKKNVFKRHIITSLY